MRAITALLIAFLAFPALAQEAKYAGLGLGSFDYSESTDDPVFGDISDTVSAYKLYGGFEINEHFAVEFGYGKSDDVEGGASGNDDFLGDFTSVIRTEFTTTTFKALGQLPLEWGVLMLGIGYFETDADIELDLVSDAGSLNAAGSVSDDGLMATFGVEWRFGQFGTGYGIRLEYEWLDVDDADAATIGLGVSYRF